jgi:hypothetical protein
VALVEIALNEVIGFVVNPLWFVATEYFHGSEVVFGNCYYFLDYPDLELTVKNYRHDYLSVDISLNYGDRDK